MSTLKAPPPKDKYEVTIKGEGLSYVVYVNRDEAFKLMKTVEEINNPETFPAILFASAKVPHPCSETR